MNQELSDVTIGGAFTSQPDSSEARPGRDSVGRKLQREIILLLAWGPAILLQLAHPLVARGIADHSTFRSGSHGHLRRFAHTVRAMLQLCFGTDQEALAVLARINAIHERVKGRLPDAVGPFAAGTPYSAHDPALLAWVHATLLDINVRVYELYVGRLSGEEKDRYCAEATAIEPRLGIPRGTLPRSFGELGQSMEAALSSGEITVTDTARTLARSILYPGRPRVAQPVLWVVRLATAGLLPPTIRDAYGLSWSARKQAMLFLSAALIRNLLRLTPRVVRHWPAARRADRRDRSVDRTTTC
jgi:uncharacterized protein (DUF2236 family)